MHSHSIDQYRHAHVFLGDEHQRNERKTWTVIANCAVVMVVEIAGGVWFGSVALVADGLHMSTCRRVVDRRARLHLFTALRARQPAVIRDW